MTLVNLDPILFQLPESIAVDRHGNICFGVSPLREIRKFDASGTFQKVMAGFDPEPIFLASTESGLSPKFKLTGRESGRREMGGYGYGILASEFLS